MNTQSCVKQSHQTNLRNSPVHEMFKAYVGHQTNHSSVFFAGQTMSYRKLNHDSDGIAHFLLSKQIQVENVVGVLMERSIDAVVSQLGILKAGGAYLPIAPDDFPLVRIHTIFVDAQVNYIISHKKHQGLVEKLETNLGRKLKCLYLDDQPVFSTKVEDTPLLKDVQVGPDNLAYVMYTSGSTGKPKGVMITHRNIISTVKNTNYVDFFRTDAVLHAAPISFDAATFEIWGALLNGLDLHIIPESIVHDFNKFSDYVRSRPISIAWLTSALFNLITETRPDFFEFLSQLMVGGEALSAAHINRIRLLYPHLKIRNNYGPTENTIFSTSFLIEKEYENNVPIGRPIAGRTAYILDENMGIVPPNTTGTLYVGGEGLARGYLNLPVETVQKFISDPFVKTQRMYATGDLCRYNSDGDIEYQGRADDQVKVRGHRIELGEIETALRTCPQVNQAIVLYKDLGAKIEGLAAYVEHADSDLTRIKTHIRAKLPQYMIPSYFESVNNFPLTTNGKIDRKTMRSWPLTHRPSPEKKSLEGKSNIEALILGAFCRVLKLEEINLKQSFFDLGGNSLSGTNLIVELEQSLDIELPLHVLYENPVIDDFIQCIKNKDYLANETCVEIIHKTLAQDAQLNFEVALKGRSIHTKPNIDDASGNLFLTGCTGFFGAFLLKELLITTKATIYCLVRSVDEAHALERIQKTLKQYKIPFSSAEKSRIVGVPGDLTKANLGLSQEKFEALTNTIDIIFHNGAVVNYVDPYSKLKPANVFGTHEVLRLSCQARIIPIHYVSSISVFETLGFFTGREKIYEHDSVDLGETYVQLGYSQSKWVAEKMMENARKEGLPINIYRSAYIMGHSETGVSNTTDHIARYIAGCIEMGSAPILNECASLTPVNQLSQALSYIAMNSKEHGNTYHLCNPDVVTVDEIYQQIKNAGFPLELISYTQWKERLKKVPNTNPLYPLLSLHIHSAPINFKLSHELTLPELYENNARFDCTQFMKALEKSGIKIDLKDPTIIERWLHSYLDAGLISKETFNQRQSNSLCEE